MTYLNKISNDNCELTQTVVGSDVVSGENSLATNIVETEATNTFVPVALPCTPTQACNDNTSEDPKGPSGGILPKMAVKNLAQDVLNGEQNIIETEELLNSATLSVGEYKKLHAEASVKAESVLDKAILLVVEISKIKGHKGARSDLHATPDSKKVILEEKFGLSELQAFRLSKLTDEAVRKEKEYARKNETLATLSHALAFVKREEQAQKKAIKKQHLQDKINSVEKVVLPEGKYNTILADLSMEKRQNDLLPVLADQGIMFLLVDIPDLVRGLDFMAKLGFEYCDCGVFLTDTMVKSGFCFQQRHRLMLVGVKNEYEKPYMFKPSSCIFQSECSDLSEVGYYCSLLERMYPDGAYLDLISQKAKDKWTTLTFEKEGN